MVIDSRMIRRFALAAFVMHVAGGSLFAQGRQDYIVQFRAGTSQTVRATVVRGAGAALGFNFHRTDAAAVRVPNAAALEALRRDPSVLAVIPDRAVFASQHATAKPGGNGGGSGGSSQVVPAGVARVGAPQSVSNGAGVGVAVVDTGVDLAHSDLSVSASSFNAFDAEQSCQDDQGHGTHVSGTIAALDNSSGVIGVAPGAAIYCVKVLDQTGSGSDATVMAGLQWVLDNHDAVTPAIRVVNMSLGRPGSVDDNPPLADLVAALDAAGISVVVAAGNDPSLETSQQIPSAYPTVIPVASATARAGSNQCRFLSAPIGADTASYFTSDGTDVVVSAPGEEAEDVSRGCLISSVGILSTRLGGGTTRMSGTSMASPHVAGIVARHYQHDLNYSPADVRGFVAADADRQGSAPLNSPTASYSFDGEREGIAQAK
jgi:subtilisin